MRWLVAAFGLVVLGSAVPGTPGVEPAAANGCTACECGVAYCEGNRTYWPRLDLDAPSGPIIAGQPLNVSWHHLLMPSDPSTPPANGTWGIGGLRTSLRVIPLLDDGSAADQNATAYFDSNDTLFPSDHAVTVVFPAPGAYFLHVETEWKGWADEVRVTVGPDEMDTPAPAHAADDGGDDDAGRITPGPSALAAAVGLALAVATRRRLS